MEIQKPIYDTNLYTINNKFLNDDNNDSIPNGIDFDWSGEITVGTTLATGITGNYLTFVVDVGDDGGELNIWNSSPISGIVGTGLTTYRLAFDVSNTMPFLLSLFEYTVCGTEISSMTPIEIAADAGTHIFSHSWIPALNAVAVKWKITITDPGTFVFGYLRLNKKLQDDSYFSQPPLVNVSNYAILDSFPIPYYTESDGLLPNITGAVATEFDVIRRYLLAYDNALYFAGASGEHLDECGALIHCSRVPGEYDGSYRTRIATRLNMVTGGGTVAAVKNELKSYCGVDPYVEEMWDLYGPYLSIAVPPDAPNPLTNQEIIDIVHEVRSVGIPVKFDTWEDALWACHPSGVTPDPDPLADFELIGFGEGTFGLEGQEEIIEPSVECNPVIWRGRLFKEQTLMNDGDFNT